MGRTVVSHGVLNYTKDNHWGFTTETGVILKVVNGDAPWKVEAMDWSIASILTLDGITNGAVYALLALALVLVFAVTRVIFIPQGEFVAYGALTLALLQLGQVPGTVWLLLVMALAAALLDAVAGLRRGWGLGAVATAAARRSPSRSPWWPSPGGPRRAGCRCWCRAC